MLVKRLLNELLKPSNPVIELGSYVASGILTSTAGELIFSIPLGRILPRGTTVQSFSCNICVRASNRNYTGLYVIKNTSGGSDETPFNTANSPMATFYDGANNRRTPTIKPTISLQGRTNLFFNWETGTANYFSGNVNNQACTVLMTNIRIVLNIPQ